MPSATTLVRVGLPLAIALAGAVLIVLGAEIIGLALVGTGAVVVVANWWMRLALSSEDDRAREDAARREFDRTGQWPE